MMEYNVVPVSADTAYVSNSLLVLSAGIFCLVPSSVSATWNDSADETSKENIVAEAAAYNQGTSSAVVLGLSKLPLARFHNQRDKNLLAREKSQNICCCRPGCTNTFPPDKRVPDKIFCSNKCYNDLRIVRKRLLHWYRLTGCLFTLAQYLLLGGRYVCL